MMKAMRADGQGGIIRGGMAEDVDRRNGTRRRRLPCEPGDIGPEVRRIRRYRPTAVLCSHARRRRHDQRAGV